MRPITTAKKGAKDSMKKMAAGSRKVRLVSNPASEAKAFMRLPPLPAVHRSAPGRLPPARPVRYGSREPTAPVRPGAAAPPAETFPLILARSHDHRPLLRPGLREAGGYPQPAPVRSP